MTNKQKWDILMARLEEKDRTFISKEVPLPPKVIYRVATRGQLEEMIVEKVGYRHLHNAWYSGKRPTNQEIERLASYIETVELKTDEILFYWRTGNMSGAESVKSLREYANLTTSKEAAEAMAKENKEKADREDALLATGDYFRCKYCWKVTPKKDAVRCTIHNIKMYGRGGRQFDYCSGQCGLHDQCAHEG